MTPASAVKRGSEYRKVCREVMVFSLAVAQGEEQVLLELLPVVALACWAWQFALQVLLRTHLDFAGLISHAQFEVELLVLSDILHCQDRYGC